MMGGGVAGHQEDQQSSEKVGIFSALPPHSTSGRGEGMEIEFNCQWPMI